MTTQKQLFPDTIESITCPGCGQTDDLDSYECGGLPDFIVQCNQILPKPKRAGKNYRPVRCWCFIDTRTMTQWDGSDDDDLEENKQ